MKIVSFKICPFVQRVTALLEAKGKAYDIEYIRLSKKPDWFMKASPHGQVPVLVTQQGEVLFESDAIVEFIEEVTPGSLFPANPVAKARERAWSYLAVKHYLVQCSAQRSASKEVLDERSYTLRAAFGKLEKTLSEDNRYFGGSSLGMVDIAWLPLLHRAAIIEARAGYDFIDGFHKVKSLQKHILATGLPEQSVSSDFEQRFSTFYLSEHSYLGQCAKVKEGHACCGDAECTEADFACCS